MSDHALIALIAGVGIVTTVAGNLILALQLRALRAELRDDFRAFRREFRREVRRTVRLLVGPRRGDGGPPTAH
jgi:hypothetical protein